MFKMFLVCFFLCQIIMLGQRNYEIFKDYLHEKHSDLISNEAIDDLIGSDASLDLDLIYFRLEYFKRLINDKNNNPTTNGQNFLRSIRIEKYINKNKWIENQIITAEKEIKKSEYFYDFVELLKSAKTSVGSSADVEFNEEKIDRNKADYFAILFLTGRADMKFERNENYSSLRKSVERELVNNFYEKAESNNFSKENFSNEYNETILNHWYLLDDNSKISLPVIYINHFTKINDVTDLPRFAVFAGYNYNFFQNTNTFNINIEETNKLFEIGKSKTYSTIVLQFDYKFFVKNTYSILSYISFSLQGTYGFSSEYNFDDSLHLNTRMDIIDNRNYTNEYVNAGEFTVGSESYYSIFSKITIPFLFITKDLFLEGGVSVGFNSFSSNLNYNYSYRKTKFTWSQFEGYHAEPLANRENEAKEEQISEVSFYISPLIDLNLNIYSPIALQVTGGYNFISAKLGVLF